MSSNQNDDAAGSCRLHRFEKNSYFHGKLMTARDMEAEQRYHVGRQKTLNRHVTGEGLLCGLEVTTVEEEDGQLSIAVGEGLALDCCGNPIVVKGAASDELPLPSGDEIYVHLEYGECLKETVPIPGSENACEQECEYNRVLEIAEISYEEEPPEFKPVSAVEYPTAEDLDDEADALATMARSYYDDTQLECETCEDRSIFVGAFARNDDGEWTEAAGTDRRPFVYTNDMLYAAIAGHVTDFGNPHDVAVSVNDVLHDGGNVDLVSEDGSVTITPAPEESEVDLGTSAESVGALVSVDGVENPGGDVDLDSSDETVDIEPDGDANSIDLRLSDAVQDRLDELDELDERFERLREEFDREIESLRRRLEPLERYVMDKTLKFKNRTFRDVAERFDSDVAAEIVRLTREMIEQEAFRDREEYFEFLEEAASLEEELVGEIEGQVADESLRRYAEAVERLQSTLDDERNVIDAAVEQDFVCETAERLQRPIE